MRNSSLARIERLMLMVSLLSILATARTFGGVGASWQEHLPSKHSVGITDRSHHKEGTHTLKEGTYVECRREQIF